MAFEEGESQELDTITEASVEDPSHSSEQGIETAPQSNPFWKEVEDKLGPNNYQLIQPYLSKVDAEYHRGITSANERLKPYQGFIDEGLDPETIRKSVNLARQLDASPETVYEHLGEFLRQNGRMPSQQELEQKVDEASDEEDPRDAQLRQLQEQQSQLQQFIQQSVQNSQKAELDRQADEWLNTEIKQLQDKNGFDEADTKEVVRIAAFEANKSGKEPDLAAAAQHYLDLQNRIRTTPRAGASAPRVPGAVGGGTPTGGGQDISTMTREQRQAYVAARLSGQQ